jgi:hypothetical protein
VLKVAEPIWQGMGAALLAMAAYSLAISPNVHEPLMLHIFSIALLTLGTAAIANGAWIAQRPSAMAVARSAVLAGCVVVGLYFYILYMSTSLSGPN